MDSNIIQDILISIAGIVVKGSLSKIGTNITDSIVDRADRLLLHIKKKLPKIASDLEADPQNINYKRIYFAVATAASDDPEMRNLLKEMRKAIEKDQKFAQEVELELKNASPQTYSISENWKGINIKGGNNTITGNTINL